ncbi:MAG: hypothetical protein Q7T25_07130 [Sideroxyarcus sp.]|nr:hypothetical protein [Sideroxyarcus sp.]
MLLASESVLPTSSAAVFTHKESESVAISALLPLDQYTNFRRNDPVATFESVTISIAMPALIAVNGRHVAAQVRESVNPIACVWRVLCCIVNHAAGRSTSEISGSGQAINDKGCFGSLCCKGFSHAAMRCVGGVVVV